MANTYGGNVVFVDTSAALDYVKSIEGIRLYGGSVGSSITIRDNASSTGNILWIGLSSLHTQFEDVCIRADRGVYVVVGGAATVYIYLKVD